MKIRKGFVTNSSSTNFIIISDKELSYDYLYEKLTDSKQSIFADEMRELCNVILNSVKKICPITDEIEKQYGGKLDKIYKKMSKKGCFIYFGSTSSESDEIESFFTCESIEFETKGFYLNGLNCVW